MEWIIAALGALMGGAYAWRRQHQMTQANAPRSLPASYVPVIYGGAFRWGRSQRESLDAICLIDRGIALVGVETVLELSFVELRGVYRHDASYSVQFDLYIEREDRWGWLSVFLRVADAPTFVKLLHRARPDQPIGDIANVTIYSAQLAHQSLYGDLSIGAEVTIYLMGRMVVVTQGDIVLAKLTTAGIRRVVATEQNGSRGLVRLYGATETTLFLSDQYLVLAQQLSDQSRAPLDIVTLSDRKDK